MLNSWFTCPALAVLVAALPAQAKNRDMPPPALPQLYQQVLDCKAVADQKARLACYDATVGALADATARREVVVTDKVEIRKVRRELFGFSLPIGRLFGSSEVDEKDGVEGASRLDTVVESARVTRTGMISLTFKEGGTWEQTDTARGFAVKPQPGEKATITRGLGGSYFVKVEGQPGIRMRRTQ